MRILLVEDDEAISKALETILTEHYYVVDVATDGQIGWECVAAFTYDLIVLDVLLPRLDGIQFCRQLRAQDCQIPVLLLTAQNSSRDRVIGLDAGADDYMVKPFEPQELLARLRVLLRRQGSARPTILEWMTLRLEPNLCEVTYDGQPVLLTPKEYRLLELFLRHPQRIFSRSVILDHLWSCEDAPGEDTVTVHIRGVRQKLKQRGAPADLIQTVYGQGYRLKPVSAPIAAAPASPTWIREGLMQQKTRAGLAAVWEKYQPLNRARCLALEQTVTAIAAGTVTPEQISPACRTAHQLAGALGIFGFIAGSNLARSIEHHLQSPALSEAKSAAYPVQHLLDLVAKLQESLQAPPPLPQHVPLWLVLDDDVDLAEQIVSRAGEWGVAIKWVTSLTVTEVNPEFLATAEVSGGLSPEPVVLFNLTAGAEAQTAILAASRQQVLPPFVLFIAEQSQLTTRVKAARLGAHMFFDKSDLKSLALPPPANLHLATECSTQALSIQVLEVIKQAQSQGGLPTAKIMVVDDDPQILAGLQVLLAPWGVQLATLEKPDQFWQMLEDFMPDLLLLDIQMPHFNGFELCQAVRTAPQWQDLPVVFLTMHLDAITLQQAIAAGGSDYISKAVDAKGLLAGILNCLERTRLLRWLASSPRSCYE
jgi:DNA-binding response OmpR family regulator/HPt (histidine-containing phosphotransfer) domain-containing protein